MSDTEVIKTIASLKSGRSSALGNPSWVVTCTDGTVYRTQTDAQISYGLGNPEFRDVPVKFTITRNGRIRYAEPMPAQTSGTNN